MSHFPTQASAAKRADHGVIQIELMTVEDCRAVAALLPDLGYGGDQEEVAKRLAAVREWPDQEVFLAKSAGSTVGMCQIQGVRLIASGGYAEVQALVVASGHQRRGIGSALVKHATRWAYSKAYSRVRLRSGIQRDTAHRFYEALGFSKSRASYAFELCTSSTDASFIAS